ncbi:MAG: hypothetical protein V1856_02990 [Candidatus Liptonbacteria bacterium]
MQKSAKRIAVVYHGDCPDGFSGAWAAWKKFGNKAEYIAAFDRHNPPLGLEGKEVYLIDFTYSMPVMEVLCKNVRRLIAIDHHISQAESVKVAHENSFALDHSGAVLAWHYFHPKKKTPKLLTYVEDYDIWNLKFKQTMSVRALMDALHYNFRVWDRLAKDMDNPKSAAKRVTEGNLVLAAETKELNRLLGYAEEVFFEGMKVMAVNSPILKDRLGNELHRKHPPLAIIWCRERNHNHISLRSDGSVDVSKIAAKYGGAGHKAAAGFCLGPGQPLPWRPSKK